MIDNEVVIEKVEDLVEEHDTTDVDETKKTTKKLKPKEEIIVLLEQVKELKEELLRNQAEVENFKKRTNLEKIKDRKYASKDLIADFLQPLEQMHKIVNMQTDNDLLKNFLIGFKMISDQLYQVLENDGLKRINALNEPFDPNYHYAVEKLSDKEKNNGINLEVIQDGYMYKDQILRPAMVKVNEWSDENGENK